MATILQLLTRCTSIDQDERYMAFNDLCVVVAENSLTEELEKKLCERVLAGLDDPSNDVQSMAVKCLSVLYVNLSGPRVVEIASKLSNMMLAEDRAKMTDVYCMGLQSMLKSAKEAMGTEISSVIAPIIISGCGSKNSSVAEKNLEALTTLLVRFGQYMQADHERIMDLLSVQLKSDRTLLRKRAGACLAALAGVVSDTLLDQLIERIVMGANSSKSNDTRTYIQAIGTLSKSIGHRMGKYVSRLAPMLLAFCGRADDEIDENSEAQEAKDELRDNCLSGLESLIQKCPRDISPFVDDLLQLGANFSRYDPNCFDEEDEDAMEVDQELDEEEEDAVDDEDSSWKVRKAAVKLLSAIAASRPDSIIAFYGLGLDKLIAGIKEKQETVKLDVLSCVTFIFQCTIKSGAEAHAKTYLSKKLDRVMKECTQQVSREQSSKVKCALLVFLKVLYLLVGLDLDPFMEAFFKLCPAALDDKSHAVKLAGLELVRILIERSSRAAALCKQFLPLIVRASRENWSAVSISALQVIDKSIAHLADDGDCVRTLYDGLVVCLQKEGDSDVVDCAMAASGTLIVAAGASIPAELPAMLTLICNKLDNDSSRLAAVRAIAKVYSSGPRDPGFTEKILKQLCASLKQSSRVVRDATLGCILSVLLNSQPVLATSDSPQLICAEISSRIAEFEGVSISLAIKVLIASLLQFKAAVGDIVMKTIYPYVQGAIVSPVLQESARESFFDLLKAMIVTSLVTFELLLEALERIGATCTSKAGVENVAKAINAICTSSELKKEMAMRCIHSLASNGPSPLLALMTVAELGPLVDLADIQELPPLLLNYFASPSEDVWMAASIALGRVAIGNMPKFLVMILRFSASSTNKYQLLVALREVIKYGACKLGRDISSNVRVILDALVSVVADEEKSVRNLAAECLGLMTRVDYATVLPVYKQLTGQGSNTTTLCTVAVSLRHYLAADESSSASSDELYLVFREVLADEDLAVREEALRVLSTSLQKSPAFVASNLQTSISPRLLDTLVYKNVIEIDLGAFKQKKDLGLPLRRLALDCVELIAAAPDANEISSFIDTFPSLLKDDDDIKVHTHKIISKLCLVSPSLVSNRCDSLIEPLSKTLHSKIPESKKGPELERAVEVIKSAARAAVSINNIVDAQYSQRWGDFFEGLRKIPTVAECLTDINSSGDN